MLSTYFIQTTYQNVRDGNRRRLFECPLVGHFPQGRFVSQHVRGESAAGHQTEHPLALGVAAGELSAQKCALVGSVRVEERQPRAFGEQHVHVVQRSIINCAQLSSGVI